MSFGMKKKLIPEMKVPTMTEAREPLSPQQFNDFKLETRVMFGDLHTQCINDIRCCQRGVCVPSLKWSNIITSSAFENQKKFLLQGWRLYSTGLSVDCGDWKMTVVWNDSKHGVWAIKRHHHHYCVAALILYNGLFDESEYDSSEADEAASTKYDCSYIRKC